MATAMFTNNRDVDRKPAELEKAPGRLLALRLGSRDDPAHRSHHPQSVAIAAALTWIGGANRGQVLKLARSKMTRPLTPHVIRGRIPELALERRHSPVDRSLAQTGNAGQRIQGRGTKGDTRGRQ